LYQNLTFSTKLITMSKNIILPTDDEPETFTIVRIMATHARGLEALAAASADNLDPVMLCTQYNNAIQLARALNASENLTEWFTTLLSDTKTLTNEWDAATTDLNTATAQLTQLRTQLTQTLALTTAAATNANNGGGQMGGRKGQTDPEKFTGEDRHKLRSFIALLRL
jgi:hypothetical protein